MKRLLIIILFYSLNLKGGEKDMNDSFKKIADDYIHRTFLFFPSYATSMGNHNYDTLMEDRSESAIMKRKDELLDFKKKLEAIDEKKISEDERIDREILLDNARCELLDYSDLKIWKKNPVEYVQILGNSINYLINRMEDPIDVVLTRVSSKLVQFPNLLGGAKENLQNPPEVYTDTAIKQLAGIYELLRKTLPEFAEKSSPSVKQGLKNSIEIALNAVKDFENFLKISLLPQSKGEWRIGSETFIKKFHFQLETDKNPDELVEEAKIYLKNAREEMFKIAKGLHDKYYPQHSHNEKGDGLINIVVSEVLKKITEDHSTKDSLMDDIKKITSDIRDFIEKNNIVKLPFPPSLLIEWTPEFRRGFSVAMLDAPGPFSPDSKTFFYVQKIPDDWTEEQVDSYLREYNKYMLVMLAVHEAFPGHYVQIWYANKHPSLIRSVFGNMSFVEGYAVLSEQIMLEAGLLNHSPELKLISMKFNLRAATNAIMDWGLHSGKMSDEEAMNLMMEYGFQEEREASLKLLRAKLSYVQLSSYFYGFSEIHKIYKNYKKKMGNNFKYSAFFSKILSKSSIPVRYLQKLFD